MADTTRTLRWTLLWLLLASTAYSQTTPADQLPGWHPLPEPGQRLIGSRRLIHTVYEDTLASIAEREGVGFEALQRANPSVDPWIPGADQVISLPTQMLVPDEWRQGITINLPERRLYYFDTAAQRLLIFPVGIGVAGFETPEVRTRVVTRIHRPSWTPTPAIRKERAARGIVLPPVVPAGQDNPMGEYAIQLAEPGLFIHGTNRPIGIGQAVSHGCIRLASEAIRALATSVQISTSVQIISVPHKVAWHNDDLYLESHPDSGPDGSVSAMVRAVVSQTQDTAIQIDWDLAYTTASGAQGLPVRITRTARLLK